MLPARYPLRATGAAANRALPYTRCLVLLALRPATRRAGGAASRRLSAKLACIAPGRRERARSQTMRRSARTCRSGPLFLQAHPRHKQYMNDPGDSPPLAHQCRRKPGGWRHGRRLVARRLCAAPRAPVAAGELGARAFSGACATSVTCVTGWRMRWPHMYALPSASTHPARPAAQSQRRPESPRSVWGCCLCQCTDGTGTDPVPPVQQAGASSHPGQRNLLRSGAVAQLIACRLQAKAAASVTGKRRTTQPATPERLPRESACLPMLICSSRAPPGRPQQRRAASAPEVIRPAAAWRTRTPSIARTCAGAQAEPGTAAARL